MNFCGLQGLLSKHQTLKWCSTYYYGYIWLWQPKVKQLKTNNDRCSFIFLLFFFLNHFEYIYKQTCTRIADPFLPYSVSHLICASDIWFIKSNKQIDICIWYRFAVALSTFVYPLSNMRNEKILHKSGICFSFWTRKPPLCLHISNIEHWALI